MANNLPASSLAGRITFLHNINADNVGDVYCSPKHYFDFYSHQDVLIVGGGASKDFFLGRALRHRAKVRVVWGVGASLPLIDKQPSSLGKALRHILYTTSYAALSTRDRSRAVGKVDFVPCVSVFNPVVDIFAGPEVGVFINSDPNASGEMQGESLLKYFGSEVKLLTASNSMPLSNYVENFKRCGRIITNSYHTAYWGLLSGREVSVIGYSTKFIELLGSFGLDAKEVIAVRRGSADDLNAAVKVALQRRGLRLADPVSVKDEFRVLNLNFANKLRDLGIDSTLKVCPQLF
jgi:hypothetical protein